ncbi:cache domain-containing sensor histidine kinase [Cohnella cellulosilytica]|uniref:Sensor histidine kinase n=1 Tax=Cohnella cellulosilytica TaxID=986710 RepID=A0ABW2FFY3_9BACL
MIFTSIRTKMMLFLLAATLIPILASILITYSLTTSKVTRETLRSNADLLFQGKTNLLNYMNAAQESMFIFYNDSRLFTILEDGIKDYKDDQEIYRGLMLLSYTAKDFEQAHLYLRESDLHYVIISNRSKRSFKGEGDRYIPSGLARGNAYVQPPHPVDKFGRADIPTTNADQVLTIHGSLYYLAAKKELGTLSIDIRLDGIRAIAEQLYTAGREELYIIDENGRTIYSSLDRRGGEPLRADWVDRVAGASESSGNFSLNQDGFSGEIVYDKMATPFLNWTLAKRIPNETLHRTAREVALINSGIAALFLVLTMLATVLITFRLTAPIKKLIRNMNQIQSGNLQVTIDVNRKDEFGILARRFQLAMDTINQMIIREYELELARKTNELNVLQVQTNPHFINNALQSIGTLSLQKRQPEIYNLIFSLGKMMRYSMNTGEPIVSLERELDYVKAYVSLQRQRFGEQIRYTVNVEEPLLSRPIPKMIVQPFVENYFKHGFDAGARDSEISIFGTTTPDGRWMRLEVRDNGKGMDAAGLKALQERLFHPKGAWGAGDSGIGLPNILSRLRLYYHESARLEVSSAKPGGFSVVLRIPIEGEEGNNESADR